MIRIALVVDRIARADTDDVAVVVEQDPLLPLGHIRLRGGHEACVLRIRDAPRADVVARDVGLEPAREALGAAAGLVTGAKQRPPRRNRHQDGPILLVDRPVARQVAPVRRRVSRSAEFPPQACW